MVYIVFSIILIRTARWLGQWDRKPLYQLTRAIGGIAAMVAVFYFAWGFNYGQVSLQERLGFVFEEFSREEIEAEFQRATDVLRARGCAIAFATDKR